MHNWDEIIIYERQAEAVVKDLYGADEKITGMSRLRGGGFNGIYHVKTNGKPGGVVIRVTFINKDALFDYEKTMMAGEKSTSDIMRAGDVPTPEIFKYSPYGEVIDREYTVSEYVPHDIGRFHREDKNKIDYRSITGILDKIHAIKGDTFGNISGDKYYKWADYIIAFSDKIARKGIELSLISVKQADKFRRVLSENISLFDEIKEPVLVHNDFWLRNLLFEKRGGSFMLKSVIDIDRALFGDADWEYARTKNIYPGFAEKIYESNKSISENRRKRRRLYRLIDSGFVMCIFKTQYKRSHMRYRFIYNLLRHT